MTRALFSSLVAMLLSLLSAIPALAQTAADTLPSNAGGEEARARARELYTRGQSAFDRGEFAEAREAFEAAYREVANPVVLLGVASAEERMERPLDAARTLRRYLAARADAPDRASIEARISTLDPDQLTEEAVAADATGTIRLSSTPPGAAISLDDAATGLVTPAEVTASIGTHRIGLALEGYEPAAEAVRVEPGSVSEIASTLTPTEPTEEEDVLGASGDQTGSTEVGEDIAPAPAPDGQPSVAVWTMTGIAGAALITGTVFGFLALSAQSDFDAAPSYDIADRGETFALVADLAFGITIAAGVTAIVLYMVEKQAPPATNAQSARARRALGQATNSSRSHWAPWASSTAAGASFGLSF